jgi:sensor histidine kinase YesM
VGCLHTRIVFCIQFGVLHAYEYYKTNEATKNSISTSEAALKNELAALKSQLNPHFYTMF